MPEDDRRLPGGNARQLGISELITDGLKYCCPLYFFEKFSHKGSEMIALRLGCSSRAVRDWQAKKRAGVLTCPGGKKCFKEWGLPSKE